MQPPFCPDRLSDSAYWGWGMSVGRWRIVRSDRSASVVSSRSERNAPSYIALAAIIPILATLAACGPSPFVQNKTQFAAPAPMPTATRQAALDLRTAPSGNIARRSVVRKVTVARKPEPATPAVLNAHPAAKAKSYDGVASFYNEDEWTARIQHPCDDSRASDAAIWHPLAR